MKLAFLSGKGGVGKTLVSTNFARLIPEAIYLDCDVEEPNGAIFLKPQIEQVLEVKVLNPEPLPELCLGCRRCVEFCKFNALAYVGQIMLFAELCHACGGCWKLCPAEALRAKERVIGQLELGRTGELATRTGLMNPGEATGVPIIKQLLHDLPSEKTVVIDCPPGSGCSVLESLKKADFAVLVAEPTAFGLHDLEMVCELVRFYNLPAGVVINKHTEDLAEVEAFCARQQLPILGKIPYQASTAALYGAGKLLVDEDVAAKELFAKIVTTVMEVATDETARHLKR